MKALKWLLGIVAGVILILAVYLTVFFDLNSFKPQIVEAVENQTGRTFVIKDDLSWSVFPSIGIKLGGISLSNPENFSANNFVEVNEAVANVELMPLLSQEVEIAMLSLDGLTVNMITQKDGTTSIDGLSGDSSAAVAEDKTTDSTTKTSVELQSLQIGGVAITNTTINLIDETTDTTQVFKLNSLTLGEFSLGNDADFAYDFSAQLPDMTVNSNGEGKLNVSKDLSKLAINGFTVNTDVSGKGIPNNQVSTQLVTDIAVALDSQNVEVIISKLSAMEIDATGKLSVNYGAKIPKINMQMDFGDIDVDKLMPASDEQTPAETEKVASTAPATEPDLSALKTIDVTMGVTIKSIKVANLLTQNWKVNATVKDGIANLSEFSANLYEGSIQATAKLDARQKVASYHFEESLTGVQFRPLLKDAADVDLISGAANFKVKGSGKSLIPDNIKKNLLAKGDFEIADGSLYGVNIPQMIRSAQDKLKGDLSAKNTEELKTDFTSLTGSFDLNNAVLTNPDLAMSSPLIRLSGNGNANIDSQTVDYKLTTSLVGSLAGQGGEKDALAGVDIPLTITGSMQDPKFGIDTSALFDAKIKGETDKLKDSLFKKLGGF
ncbi:cell envelope biogenesis protein AsmA [Shewanella sp. UCD-FRSSP16_17]|uniref:AsmA family protein n=1 Tax=Shewanella sp. UCD-FRSSP16_17 TaxID=1853256 RepID=UPI0007EEA02E|nr:AsmA family protein [Shewanella sp. UCD-FRSSP16_17]OBT11677.1 cell envelope biogenesis protein AsmA [Shewanella sp. UCD-FRSSP16_17]